MRKIVNIHSLIVLAGLLLCSPAIHAEEYATKRLARMAQVMEKQKPAFAVTKRTNSYGEVVHIGMKLFPDAMRTMVPSPTYDFLERFLMELNMANGEERERLLMQNFVTFTVGTPTTALKVDTTCAYTIDKIANFRYRSTWSRDGKTLLQMVYDMNWQMMSGCSIGELEKDLEKRLLRHQTEKVDTLPVKGTYIMSPVIKNDLYLADKGLKGANGRTYVFDKAQFSRSVANMMLAEDLPVDVDLKITVNRYDYITDVVTVPLHRYLNFCRTEEGCTAYFGLKDVKDDVATGILLFVNSSGGFMHMLSVTVDRKVIEKAKGTVNATLLPYIPLHNVKKEYLNLTEYETVE